VDITTHVVDQAQWLTGDDEASPALLSARAWSTPVPAEAFRRITGEAGVPRELAPFVAGGTLGYRWHSEVVDTVRRVTPSASARGNLAPSPGGAASSRMVAHGTRADVRVEQSERTGYRRKVFVESRADAADVTHALHDTVTGWQRELPGLAAAPAGPNAYELVLPAALDGGHETHFARVLDGVLRIVDEGRWPAALAQRTLGKYALLAEAAAKTS